MASFFTCGTAATTANCVIWNNWCSEAGTLTTNNCSANNTVWLKWTSGTATSAQTANCGVWVQWCTNSDNSTAPIANVQYRPAPSITPAQAENYKRLAEENAKRAEEEKRKRIAAEKRAERLLKKLLTSEQLRDYQRKGHFHVIGKSGQRYRIRKNSYAGNIDVIGANGRAEKVICCHPDGVPLHDGLITQKLALEHNEAEFLKVANIRAAAA